MANPTILRPVNQSPVSAQCQRMQAVAAWADGNLSVRRVTPSQGWIAAAGMALSIDGYNAMPAIFPTDPFPLRQFHHIFFGDLDSIPTEHQLPLAGQGYEMQCPSIRNPGTFLPVTFTERSPLFAPFAMDTIQAAFQACDTARDAVAGMRYFESIRAWMAYPEQCIRDTLRAARAEWRLTDEAARRDVETIDVLLGLLTWGTDDEISQEEASDMFWNDLASDTRADLPPHIASIHDAFTADVLTTAAAVEQCPVHFFGVDFALAQWLLGPDAIFHELRDENSPGGTLVFGALRASDGRDIPITADVVTALISHFGRIPTTGEDHAQAMEFVTRR